MLLHPDDDHGDCAQDERHDNIDNPRIQCQEPRLERIDPTHAGDATAAPPPFASSATATRILRKQDSVASRLDLVDDYLKGDQLIAGSSDTNR